jgi:membrane protein implicated in regulation of membrane protease activity
MNRKGCVLYLIVGIFIVGALIAGLVLLSFIMLPFIAVIAIAALIYYLVTRRGRRGKKVPSEGKEATVKSSSYTVSDAEESDPPSKKYLNERDEKEISDDPD